MPPNHHDDTSPSECQLLVSSLPMKFTSNEPLEQRGERKGKQLTRGSERREVRKKTRKQFNSSKLTEGVTLTGGISQNNIRGSR